MPDPLELPVDVDEVAEAMDVGTRDTIDFFLDTQTGAVVVTGDGIDDPDIDPDDDARYQHIPPRETFENYELMRDFIDALDDCGFAERVARDSRGRRVRAVQAGVVRTPRGSKLLVRVPQRRAPAGCRRLAEVAQHSARPAAANFGWRPAAIKPIVAAAACACPLPRTPNNVEF
jgi:hypothetical protein